MMGRSTLAPLKLASIRHSVGMLVLGGVLALCVVVLASMLDRPTAGQMIILIGFSAFAIGIIVWYTVKIMTGEPALEVDAGGILYRIPGLSTVAIPWDAVIAIDRESIEVRNPLTGTDVFDGPQMVTVPEAILVAMPIAFYEAAIADRSAIAKGPGWGSVFVVGEDRVRMVLDSRAFERSPDWLHERIVERWHAARAQGNA